MKIKRIIVYFCETIMSFICCLVIIKIYLKTFIFILLIFFSSTFNAQNSKSITICKSVEPTIIDGELNESHWQVCEPAGNFWQNFPYDTCLSKSKTTAYVTYNDKSIYVAAICYDSLPGNYVVQSLKRDFLYPVSDCFVFTLDPFLDKQNGFSFGVNPYGAQREGLVAGGGGQGPNVSWDNKWFSAVKRKKKCWIVEMEIPFKTIRYKNDISNWGINFSRNDLKQNENSSWAKVPRQFNVSSLAFVGTLNWDTLPKKAGRNIAIIPYGIAKVNKDFVSKTPASYEFNGGVDAKIALSSSLNLDFTFNPDFSQVEVDRQITNLTRFSLIFPEQRQFFIENSDLFANFGFRQIRPFFSRRIGYNNGSAVPIIAGLRLSGKPNKNWRIGVMDIQTAKTKINEVDVFAQNYFVAALQRNVFKRSNVSFIFVNRQQYDSAGFTGINFNRVVGADYNLISDNNKWMGKAFFHHSLSNSKNNDAYTHATWLSYNTQKINIQWNHEYVNKNYNAETGFTPRIFQLDYSKNITIRNTYWRLEPSINYFFYPKKSVINKMGPRWYMDYYANDKFSTTDMLNQFGWDFNAMNTSGLSIDYHNYYTNLIYPTDVTFTGNLALPIAEYRYQDFGIKIKTNQRKILNALAGVTYGSYFTGTKLSYNADIVFRKQPYAIITASYTHDEIILPHLSKKVYLDLIGPKIELSFTKSIFFTTFIQYNSQIKNVNINARFQWRFKPMSDLFIVYSDNYYSENFGEKNRGVVLKFVYWLNI